MGSSACGSMRSWRTATYSTGSLSRCLNYLNLVSSRPGAPSLEGKSLWSLFLTDMSRGGSRGGAVAQLDPIGLDCTRGLFFKVPKVGKYTCPCTPFPSVLKGRFPPLSFPCLHLLLSPLSWGKGKLQSCSCLYQPGCTELDSAGNSKSGSSDGWGR